MPAVATIGEFYNIGSVESFFLNGVVEIIVQLTYSKRGNKTDTSVELYPKIFLPSSTYRKSLSHKLPVAPR